MSENEKYKVSIIVPIYNVEKYLLRCLNSLLNQTLRDIEIILVDDGSPDCCPQMCDEYAKKDARIKVIHKKNGGLSSARNAGLDIARGEYVAFVDSDDYTSCIAYETLYNAALDEQLDVVYAGFECLYSDKNSMESFVFDKKYQGQEIVSFLSEMLCPSNPIKSDKERVCMSVWNAIYKRSIIEKFHIRFKSERTYLSEDILFHLDFLPHCKVIRCIPQIFYHYCENGGSLTHNFNENKIKSNFKLYEMMLQIIRQNGLDMLEYKVMMFFFIYIKGIIMKGIMLSSFSIRCKEKCVKKYMIMMVGKIFFLF